MKHRFVLFLFLAVLQQAAAQYASITRGPYLQAAGAGRVVICWRTAGETQSAVWYGDADTLQHDPVVDTAFTWEYRVLLEGLKPNTVYKYAVGDAEGYRQQQVFTFRSLPVVSDTSRFSVVALGDCGTGSINQRRVAAAVFEHAKKNNMDAWLLLGDNAYQDGTDRQYGKKFFKRYAKNLAPQFPLYPVPGNHDYANDGSSSRQADSARAYYRSFVMPVDGASGGVPSGNPAYYSFDIGSAHFIALDSYGLGSDGKRLGDTTSLQAQWLQHDLQKAQRRPWIIVYWHHPPYTMTSHNSDLSGELVQLRQQLLPLLERFGVDLVPCGHSHAYERSFLMKGHFGMEATYDSAKHRVDPNSCSMKKVRRGNGTVYVVSGTAGQRDREKQAGFPHDAMFLSRTGTGGAVTVEGNGKQLQVRWLLADGSTGDCFTLEATEQ